MKIHIGKSKLHGKGLIASRDIKKDETLFTIKGNKLKFLINNKTKAKMAGLNWIGISKNQWVDPIDYGLYINHSCNPNSGIKGKLTIVAIKNIKKGEEITSDYSLSEADIFWSINCNCGSKNCRKIVKSIQFLPNAIFRKNQKYIPIYFKKSYSKFNVKNFKTYNDMEIAWVNFIKKGFSI